MRPDVGLQIGFLNESLRAVRAREFTFPFMDLHVAAQVLLPLRLEFTVSAFEREVLVRILVFFRFIGVSLGRVPRSLFGAVGGDPYFPVIALWPSSNILIQPVSCRIPQIRRC